MGSSERESFMTLDQVIQMADSIKPNAFPANAKTEWVNECEGMVQTQVMLFAIEEVITYDYERDKSKELLVLPPHSKIYWAYVCAMIDFANGEYDKYANSMQMFNAFFGEYMRWFAKVYRPADTHAGTIEDEKFWKGYYLTAYGLAVKHGYTGSESEWVDMIGGHPAKKDNPHEVTAEQVGTYKKAEIDAKTAPFEEHLKDFSNPHLVTSEQIGTYSKAEIDAQAEVTAKALEDANSEIAAKLTKITEFYPVDRVYGVNMAGRQVMLEAHRDFNSDGGIPVYDNNGVIKTGTPAKDTDSVNKKYVDDKAAGKLDKVKSDFVFYPKVYATNSTDGTPYLMTATSNLGYIGKGSGYIATYDGGELKTGTPTSDDSAANKAYVDSEIKSLQEPYELIEEITLTEATSLVTRDKWPNGDAYSFSKIRVEVDSNAITAGFNTYVRYENDSTAHTSAIMSNAGVKYFATFDGRIENGYLTETVVNTNSRRANNAALLQSAASTPMSAIQFLKIWFNSSATLNNVGTTIRIYGVRA